MKMTRLVMLTFPPTGASFCDLCTAERLKTGTFHVQCSACTKHDVESIIAGAYEGPPAAFSHSLTVAAGRYPTKHSAADGLEVYNIL